MYFDIDDILCEEQTLKARFLETTPWTGPFFSHREVDFIDPSTTYELPCWIASPLAVIQKIQVSFPRFYGPKFREELLTCPKSVKLGPHCNYFHQLAIKIMGVLPDNFLYRTILQAFMERFPEIIRHSLHSSETSPLYVEKLDHIERSLFNMGRG